MGMLIAELWLGGKPESPPLVFPVSVSICFGQTTRHLASPLEKRYGDTAADPMLAPLSVDVLAVWPF
jgi:hypothetical protein